MTKSNGKSLPVKSARQSLPIAGMTLGALAGKSNEQLLELLASTINALRKRVSDDVIEIGQRLVEAKALAGHGNWLPWLKREFGWTDDTARNYIRVYEKFKNRNFRDLELPVSSLYLLAAPSTPPEAVEAVIARVEAGEKMTGAEVKRAIDDAKTVDEMTTPKATEPAPEISDIAAAVNTKSAPPAPPRQGRKARRVSSLGDHGGFDLAKDLKVLEQVLEQHYDLNEVVVLLIEHDDFDRRHAVKALIEKCGIGKVVAAVKHARLAQS